MSTLTNANSALFLSVDGLYPIPQQMQGFSTDDMFSGADVQVAEVQMGVDARLSAGYTPYPFVFDVTLQADSASNDIFDNVLAAQKAIKDLYVFQGAISLPGIGAKFIMTRGFLTTASPMPTGKKLLQPRKYVITFQDLSKAPF